MIKFYAQNTIYIYYEYAQILISKLEKIFILLSFRSMFNITKEVEIPYKFLKINILEANLKLTCCQIYMIFEAGS